MTLQNILTLSIDAIALSFAAMMVIDFSSAIVRLWCKSASPSLRKNVGICVETLAPIFEDISEESAEKIADPWTLPLASSTIELCPKAKPARQSQNVLLLPSASPVDNLIQLNIRQLKKKASAAKVRNYNVMTKAQLVQALAA